jgi:hypothetical protein
MELIQLCVEAARAFRAFGLQQEIQAACRAHVAENPKAMPNEGHILAMILRARQVSVNAFKARLPPPQEPPRELLPVKDRQAIAAKYGMPVLNRMPQGGIE